MIVVPAGNFNKSVAKIKDKIAIKRLNILIKELESVHNLGEISNVKPVANNPNVYRIRKEEIIVCLFCTKILK